MYKLSTYMYMYMYFSNMITIKLFILHKCHLPSCCGITGMSFDISKNA